MAKSECLTPESMERLAADPAAEGAQHLRSCPACRGAVEQIRRDNAMLGEFVAVNRDRLAQPLAMLIAPPGYELGHEIHRGAQGIVFRATQVRTHRAVAIKYLLGGAFSDARARIRFEREVEIAAALRHPGIVTIYDSGVDESGRPWIAMELVDGCALNEAWSADPPPPLEQKIPQFISIARAVAYAHARAIVHRDLKPQNILVDGAGQPRILDFGVAKALESSEVGAGPGGDHGASTTLAGEFVGTLAYAAPEQVGGDPSLVDTRADQYALGVILHQLLTGRRPYELRGSVQEVVRTILTAEPAPLDRSVPRDLETIMRRALAKDPDRRYPGVGAMVEDLERYGRGQAIEARRDEPWYLLRRFIAQHRTAVSLSAAIVLTLVIGLVVSLVLYNQKRTAAHQVTQTVEGVVDLMASIDRENPEAPPPARDIGELLDEAALIVEHDLADQPRVAAPLLLTLGRAFLSRARFDEAEHVLMLARDMHGPKSQGLAACLHDLGRLEWKRAKFESAEQYYREALAMRRSLLPADHPDVARTLSHLASTLRRRGQLVEAEQAYREALAIRQRTLDASHPDIGNSMNGLGACLLDRGLCADAAEHFHDAALAAQATFGADDWRAARALDHMAIALVECGELVRAREAITRSRTIKEEQRPDDEVDRADGEATLSRLLLAEGSHVQARSFALAAHERRSRILGPGHPDTLELLVHLGRIARAAGDAVAAESLLSEAWRGLTDALGAQHWQTLAAETELALVMRAAGKLGPAQRHLDHAMPQLRRVLDAHAPLLKRVEQELRS